MKPSALFERRRLIEPRHIDRLGHVNNLIWLEFVLELAQAHSASVGLDGEATARHGGLWIVSRQEVDYLQPALPGDELLEQTWVSVMKGARSVRHSRFTRLRDDLRLLSAVTQWAYVDVKTQRPRRIDRAVLESFRPLASPPE